jgi:GNAT superfamily N-acetyltransferase
MKIRKLEAADIPHLVRLFKGQKTIEDYPNEFTPAVFKSFIGNVNSIALIAEIKGKLAAAELFHLDPVKKKVFLEAIIIDEKHRGKGIASNLIEAMEKYVRQRRYKRIVFFSWAWNAPMHRLARKKGYQAIEKAVLFGKKITQS